MVGDDGIVGEVFVFRDGGFSCKGGGFRRVFDRVIFGEVVYRVDFVFIVGYVWD